MRIFISWSGNKSKVVAKNLFMWLPCIYQSVRPWMSETSIPPGGRWSSEIFRALDESDIGIICLTRDNLGAPWLLFEAGVLSRTIKAGLVVPILIDLEPSELSGPLAQFQAVRLDRSGIRSLLLTIAETNPVDYRPVDVFMKVFEMWWPSLEKKLDEELGSYR